MTGGSLPAQTWHQIMAYAPQGIDLKQIPGVPPPDKAKGPPQVAASDGAATGPEALRPTMLTKRSIDVLLRVEHLLDEAARSAEATVKARPPGAASAAPAESAEDALAEAAQNSAVRRN
jgi:penicillin-binding protein 1A